MHMKIQKERRVKGTRRRPKGASALFGDRTYMPPTGGTQILRKCNKEKNIQTLGGT